MGKIKVLQYTSSMNRAGAETLLMNIYRNINRDKFEFHFITHYKEKSDYEDEIIKLGGKVIYIDRPKIKNLPKYSKDFRALVENYGPYNAIHSHMQLFNGIVLREAKKNNIEVRISHAHLNGDYNKSTLFRKIYERYSMNMIDKYSNYKMSCSYDSGKYLYNSEQFMLLNNAIDINLFNLEKKEYFIHEELGLERNIKFITNIARFVDAKNHDFIIEIFDKVMKTDNSYRLLLVGEGELKEKIINKCKEKGIEKYVYFLGIRSDINKILASTDVFLMPSILEGLPVVLVEAQAAGIPCIVSNNIPSQCDLGLKSVKFLDLTLDISKWVEAILNCKRSNIDFKIRREKIINNGYDLDNNVEILSKIYENLK